VHPKLFNAHFLNTYGLSVCVGLVLSFVVFRKYARVKGMDPAFAVFVEGNYYVAVLGGMALAMLSQSGFNYIANPAAGFHLGMGMTVISGLVGGTGVFMIGYMLRGRPRFGRRLMEVAPITPACMVIAHAFGRVGCFFAGCCYGRLTDSWLGLRFPHTDHAVFPTQLMEAGFLFLLFALLYHLAVRRNFKHTFTIYLAAYGTFRFLIEFIRGDERGAFVGSLSPSQTLSLLLVAGSVWFYFFVERLAKAYEANPLLSHKISVSETPLATNLSSNSKSRSVLP
jgi:phosphatidylglycerol:prolipoprotein diacylglycerol transferase